MAATGACSATSSRPARSPHASASVAEEAYGTDAAASATKARAPLSRRADQIRAAPPHARGATPKPGAAVKGSLDGVGIPLRGPEGDGLGDGDLAAAGELPRGDEEAVDAAALAASGARPSGRGKQRANHGKSDRRARG